MFSKKSPFFLLCCGKSKKEKADKGKGDHGDSIFFLAKNESELWNPVHADQYDTPASVNSQR